MQDLVSKALGEKFVFTIANASGAAKVVALIAAYFDTLLITSVADVVTKKYSDATAIAAAGYDCNAVVDDGTFATGLTCTTASSKKSYRAFREYLKQQGRVVVDMSIQANNVDVFNGSMEVVKCSPVSGDVPQTLYLQEFYSVDQSQSSKINVKALNLELTYDSLVLLPIADGRSITFTFKF